MEEIEGNPLNLHWMELYFNEPYDEEDLKEYIRNKEKRENENNG